MEINHKELIELLKDYSGEIQISYENTPTLRKSGNPFYLRGDKITCITDSKYVFGGQSYAERVNDALQSEGKDKVESWGKLPWGEWLVDNRVIENNGAYYLRVYKEFKPDMVQYFVNGVPATFEQKDMINSLRSQKVVNTTSQGGVALEKRVSLVNLAFSGIHHIVLNGVVYNIKH